MKIDLTQLPPEVKLEIKLADLIAFAEALMQGGIADYSQLVKNDDEDEFLDFNEMRRYLKLAQSTAYQKVSNGEIPHYKKGRRLYFKKEELTSYLESGRKHPNH
jgi:excisionase family DNA binding protein